MTRGRVRYPASANTQLGGWGDVPEVPVGRQRFKAVVPRKRQLWSTGTDYLTDDNEAGFDGVESAHTEIR